jgi:thiol-disulfide isomerase/thioredoxin
MRSSFLCVVAFAVTALASAQTPGPTTTPSGLQYTVTSHGAGPLPKEGQVVIVHYTGSLPDGTVFDSSREHDQPYAFTLGKKQVIKGWDEAFALLHVGDKATLLVPPDLAYGARAMGKIPANSLLRFDVEVLAVKDRSLADALQESIDRDGLAAATGRFTAWKADNFSQLYPDESQLNNLGYHYLQANKLPEALAVLRWNVELFPQSGNVYDSYGEALVKDGQGAPAIASYEKSIQLDPKNQNAVRMLAELKASPDAVATMQQRMLLDDAFNEASAAAEKGQPVALADLKAKLVAVLAKNPSSEASAQLVGSYFYLVESVDLKKAVEEWNYFLTSPNEKIRELAQGKMGLAAALKAPLEMKFKAIDGREVDVAALRGQVVLVDFWATWCGPCREEIPNIVATYEKYHPQGFAVVGISFDQAPDAGQPAKRQKSADEVAAFTADHHMPWPQYYDGLYWNNTYGKLYGIRAIPAMFLLDKNGLIVSTNARGAKLEQEVKRLLGL